MGTLEAHCNNRADANAKVNRAISVVRKRVQRMLSCAFGWSDGAKVERLHPMARPLRLPLGFAIRMEDGAGTNRLWPIVPKVS